MIQLYAVLKIKERTSQINAQGSQALDLKYIMEEINNLQMNTKKRRAVW